MKLSNAPPGSLTALGVGGLVGISPADLVVASDISFDLSQAEKLQVHQDRAVRCLGGLVARSRRGSKQVSAKAPVITVAPRRICTHMSVIGPARVDVGMAVSESCSAAAVAS